MIIEDRRFPLLFVSDICSWVLFEERRRSS